MPPRFGDTKRTVGGGGGGGCCRIGAIMLLLLLVVVMVVVVGVVVVDIALMHCGCCSCFWRNWSVKLLMWVMIIGILIIIDIVVASGGDSRSRCCRSSC